MPTFGDTFRFSQIDTHVWIVLSDPGYDPENVLIVNMTTLAPRKDQACILRRGDHPAVSHDTCISYRDGHVVPLETLTTLEASGLLTMGDPLSNEVLDRVLAGAAQSKFIFMEYLELLNSQGVLPDE